MFPMVSSLSSDPRFALRQALATLLCMGYCCTSLPLAAAYALLELVMPLLAATCLLARNPAGARIGWVNRAMLPEFLGLHSRYSAYFASLANGGLAAAGAMLCAILQAH
jgi:hypothetical protein